MSSEPPTNKEREIVELLARRGLPQAQDVANVVAKSLAALIALATALAGIAFQRRAADLSSVSRSGLPEPVLP